MHVIELRGVFQQKAEILEQIYIVFKKCKIDYIFHINPWPEFYNWDKVPYDMSFKGKQFKVLFLVNVIHQRTEERRLYAKCHDGIFSL